jgi:hypothetical protein
MVLRFRGSFDSVNALRQYTVWVNAFWHSSNAVPRGISLSSLTSTSKTYKYLPRIGGVDYIH